MEESKFLELMDGDSGHWDGDNAFQGCQIVAKYVDNIICAAEHDKIFSAGVSELCEAGITEEDVIELRRLNWMVEDGEYLACFV